MYAFDCIDMVDYFSLYQSPWLLRRHERAEKHVPASDGLLKWQSVHTTAGNTSVRFNPVELSLK